VSTETDILIKRAAAELKTAGAREIYVLVLLHMGRVMPLPISIWQFPACRRRFSIAWARGSVI